MIEALGALSARIPETKYASGPSRAFNSGDVPVMIAAAKPTPAITINTCSSARSSMNTRPMSTARFVPDNAIRVAWAGSVSALARLRASRLDVPVGTRPSGMPDPARACATWRTVPSPPQVSTTSAPAASALLA